MCLSIKVHRPNDVLGEGKHKGFEWAVVHNGMGYRCGYVRVPKGHPWHGKHYDDVEADCHGGLTFAEPDEPCDKGGPDGAWWFGFDCGHYNDAQDLKLSQDHVLRIPGGVVRTQEYVESECRKLCEQAAEAGGGS